jgi:hypothetical protein
MRPLRAVVVILVLGWLAGQTAHPCGPDHLVRAYLSDRFWQPLAKSHGGAWPPRASHQAFAGMGRPRGAEMARVHAAYQELEAMRRGARGGHWEEGPGVRHAEAVAGVRRALESARAAALRPEEAEEVELLQCKVALREAEWQGTGLPRVKARLQRFLAASPRPPLASEARGWLARVHYLLGEHHAAARIYLRELDEPRSVFDRDGLLRSLRLVFPYNGSAARLADHLEEYFDDPRRALFVVNLVTNPVYSDPEDLAAREAVGRKALEALERHPELFRQGGDSEALALALMRAALHQGDHERARAFAEKLPAASSRRADAELHWMAAVAAVLGGRDAEAEPHLRAVAEARRAPRRYRRMALHGLVGISLRLGRVPDAIEAALRFEAGDRGQDPPEDAAAAWVESQLVGAWLLDLPYLLDFQATEDDLRATLARLEGQAALPLPEAWSRGGRRRTAQEVVTYALAVRVAQREQYAESARLFARAGAGIRARRMREAAQLHAAAQAGGGAAGLEARYAYAAFLAEHSTQVFFNDMLWAGFQRYALVAHAGSRFCAAWPRDPSCGEADGPRLDAAAREAMLVQERRVRDAQEERWRAYLLLDAVAAEAGPGPLRRRAAAKAIEALEGINAERFGRGPEIAAARRTLARLARS